MSIRSRLRLLGIRLLEKLVGSQPGHRDHGHACRVCVAEQTIRTDDHTICAFHLLTHLDSLAPSVQVSSTSQPFPAPAPAVTTVVRATSTSTHYSASSHSTSFSTSTHKIPRKSLPARQPHTFVMTPSRPSSQRSSSAANCVRITSNAIRQKSMAVGVEVHTRHTQTTNPSHVVRANALVQSLQCALGNLRYAITGHLAFELQTSCFSLTNADTKNTFHEMLAVSQVSTVSSPSIVCPRSTLDVLPSWAAASRGNYTFGTDFGDCDDGTYFLRINVNGTMTKVNIDWVDDEQFNCAPYVVEDLIASCSSGIVPVLSVSSLINQAAGTLGSVSDLTLADESLLKTHITIGLQIKEIQGLTIPPVEAPALYQMDFVKKYCNELIQQSLFDHLFSEIPQPNHIRRKPVPSRSA